MVISKWLFQYGQEGVMKTRKKGRVRAKLLSLDQAAEHLTDLTEKHLSSMSESERRARLDAFYKTVAKICERHSKSVETRRTARSLAVSRGRG